MPDVTEFARSVIRVPVAGPAPNNTLIYVRAQFPPSSEPSTGRWDPKQLFTVTLYQIAGFDQSRLHEYAANTKISVTGWLNMAKTVGDQEIGFAIDEVWGNVTDDGHIAITANTSSKASDYETVHDFWLSAYILAEEPEHDFSRPPIDWSAIRGRATSNPAQSYSATTGIAHRPLGKDEAKIEPSPFADPHAIRHCDP